MKILLLKPFWEFAFSVFLILGMSVVLVQAAKISPSPFDELGSAFFPKLIAVFIILLSLPVCGKSFWKMLAAIKSVETSVKPKEGLSDTLAVSLLSIAYVAIFTSYLVPFSILTSIFLIAAALWMSGFNWRRIARIAPVMVIGSFALEYLFTHVFVMDIPKF